MSGVIKQMDNLQDIATDKSRPEETRQQALVDLKRLYDAAPTAVRVSYLLLMPVRYLLAGRTDD